MHCLNSWWLGLCPPFAVCVGRFPERGTTHTMMSSYFISNLKTLSVSYLHTKIAKLVAGWFRIESDGTLHSPLCKDRVSVSSDL